MTEAVETNYDRILFYGWLALMVLVFLLSGTVL